MENGHARQLRRFFRIAETNPPRRYDFTSNAERGIEPRRSLSARDQELWHGVSHMATLESARRRLRDSPWLGLYIAEIEIPADAVVRIEQTGRHPLHYTIWADASDLLAWTVRVWSIDPVE